MIVQYEALVSAMAFSVLPIDAQNLLCCGPCFLAFRPEQEFTKILNDAMFP
jgi:hypothetical protein